MGEAIAICKKHRLYFVRDKDRGRGYLLFRKRPEGDPRHGGIFVDKTDGAERALLNMVRRAAGEPVQPQPETAF